MCHMCDLAAKVEDYHSGKSPPNKTKIKEDFMGFIPNMETIEIQS